MTRGRRICEVVHIVALGVWLGALVMTGATAAMVFPRMRGLDPSLPAYTALEGPHWSLAAGHIVDPVFLAGDAVQFVCALAAGVTFGLAVFAFGLSQRRVSTFVRATLVLGLVTLVSYQLLALRPEMGVQLEQYRAAARAGDPDAAAIHKAAFDANHPVARNLLAADAAMVLAALIIAAWTATSPRAGAPDPEPASEPLEEPRLARGGR